MPAHTPGPWQYTETRGFRTGQPTGRHTIIGGPSNPYEIARIITVADNVRNVDDARLIAAAPSLLEALKDMTCPRCEHAWCDRARQVIGEATNGRA